MTNLSNCFQFNRRDFLRAAAGAAGLGLAGTPASAGMTKSGGTFEVAVASWSFNRLLPSYRPRYRRRSQDIMKQLNLMDYPQFIADLGVKGLEFSNHQIPTYSEDYLSGFKERIEAAGCHVTSVMNPGGNYGSGNATEWKQTLKRAVETIKMAGYLNARLVRCDIGRGHDEPGGIDRIVKATKEILSVARDFNIILATENHGEVARKPDVVIGIVEAVNEPDFGVVADFRNFADAEIREYGMKKFAPYAVGASAKGIEHDADGEETTFDFPMCIKILKDSGFKGVMAVEFEGRGDQLQGVKNVHRLIDKYWYGKM